MLADISNVDAIYIVCGRTDMRKSIDGCILRSPADSDAFQSGRYAEHNGRSKTLDFIV